MFNQSVGWHTCLSLVKHLASIGEAISSRPPFAWWIFGFRKTGRSQQANGARLEVVVLLCVILRAIVAMRQTLKSFFPSQPAETWIGGCVLRPRLGVAGSTVSRMGASDAKSAALLRREVQPGPSAAYHTGGSRCGLWLREQGRDLASARSRRRNRPHSFRQSLQNAIARRLCRFRGRESHDLRFRKRGTFFSYSSPPFLNCFLNKMLPFRDVCEAGVTRRQPEQFCFPAGRRLRRCTKWKRITQELFCCCASEPMTEELAVHWEWSMGLSCVKWNTFCALLTTSMSLLQVTIHPPSVCMRDLVLVGKTVLLRHDQT